MIQLEENHRLLIKEILKEASNVEFFAFGSRAKNDSVKFSDLDLAYKVKISPEVLLKIKTKLAESTLPFTVDLVYLEDCDKDFRDLMKDDLVLF